MLLTPPRRPVTLSSALLGMLVSTGILVNTGARLRVMPLIFETLDSDYSGFVNSMYTMGASPNTIRKGLSRASCASTWVLTQWANRP